MAELTPGTEYFDYTIERLVGRGGFGAVYVARDRRLDRRVALKVLEPSLAADPVARRRFIDESRLAASLDHPNIIPIYEAGEEDEQLFLAMRYVSGPDLADTIERDGAIEPVRAGRIVRQVASALDAAHAAGLVHRDVKPGNVLLAPGTESTDHAYLTDFGLSKRVGGAGAVSQTEAGRFVGTVGYVAPEQIKGRSVDARADIYSLGCVAYHALTGHQPFERDSEIGTLLAHAEEPPHSVYETLPDMADRVDPVIARAMAKNPADRYPSAGAFAADLTAALSARQPSATVTRGFLFADLRGFTAFIEAHGDDVGVRLLDAFRRMVRLVVARHHGAEIRTEGDSFYVVFPSASAAVQAGLGIVEGAATETEHRPELPITVGVGVHAGESSEWVEGYVGSSVNIAARLCAQAEPGEVLVSDTVRTLIRTNSKLDFVDRGQRTLKGIDEPMATWSAVPRDVRDASAATAGRTRGMSGRLGRSPAVAVVAAPVVLVAGAAVAWLMVDPLGGPGESLEPVPSDATEPAPIEAPREMVAFSRFIPASTAHLTNEEQVIEAQFACEGEPRDAKLMLADLEDPEAPPVRLSRATDLLEYWPSWSADGSTITSVGFDQVGAPGLYVIDGDGRREVRLPADDLGGNNGFAAVTADGESVVWKGSDFEGYFHFVATDGSSSERSVAGGDDARGPRSDVEERLWLVRPLPDDRLLSVWVDGYMPIDDDPYVSRFKTMAIDGTEQVSIGPTLEGEMVGALVVSPAGDRSLLGTVPVDENGDPLDVPLEWHLMSLAGDSGELTPLDIEAISAGWSSDGSRLYLVHADAPGTLVEHDLASGQQREVLDIGTGAICGPVARVIAPGEIGLPPPVAPGEPSPFERALLEPGDYLIERFKPAMTATFGSDWLGGANFVDGWQVSHLDEPDAELSVSQILVGLSGPCDDDAQQMIGSRPQDLVDWLMSRDDLAVSLKGQVPIGGRTGIAVEIAPVPGTACPYSNDWNLYLPGDDIVWMTADEILEWTAVSVGNETVVFQKRAPKGQMDAFDELMDPVIGSLEFVVDA